MENDEEVDLVIRMVEALERIANALEDLERKTKRRG